MDKEEWEIYWDKGFHPDRYSQEDLEGDKNGN